MPDLASFAAGLIGTLGGGLLEDRQTEQAKKDQELVRQLAAYHALLEHPDTPESEIPNIVDAQAKLLKAEKHFAPITAKMREAMRRQVPYGPEKESAQSINDRISANSSGIPETTMELPGTIAMRPTNSGAVPLGGGQPRTAPDTAVPLGGNQPRTPSDAVPLGGGSFAVTTPALLPRVPDEPTMYQPTVERSTLTQSEWNDSRKARLYAEQQETMARRQLKIQDDAQEAAAERERARAEAALKLEENKQKGRIAVVQRTYEEKGKLLGPAAMAKIEAPRVAYENSLIAGGMNENEAKAASYRLFQAQMDVDLQAKKQKIEESKARVNRIGIQNTESFERVRKSKAGLAGAFGVSASMKREFDLRTGTLQDDLTHTLQLLDDAYKKAAGVPKVGTIWENSPEKREIDRLEAKKDELWLGIDEVRNGLLNQGAPSVPGAPASVRPKSDPLGLFP